jgi:hypothetical protein
VVHDEDGLAEDYVPLNVDSVYRQDRAALSDSTFVADDYCGTTALRNYRDVHPAIPVDQYSVTDANVPGDSAAQAA